MTSAADLAELRAALETIVGKRVTAVDVAPWGGHGGVDAPLDRITVTLEDGAHLVAEAGCYAIPEEYCLYAYVEHPKAAA
jgi:hypothetical protein